MGYCNAEIHLKDSGKNGIITWSVVCGGRPILGPFEIEAGEFSDRESTLDTVAATGRENGKPINHMGINEIQKKVGEGRIRCCENCVINKAAFVSGFPVIKEK